MRLSIAILFSAGVFAAGDELVFERGGLVVALVAGDNKFAVLDFQHGFGIFLRCSGDDGLHLQNLVQPPDLAKTNANAGRLLRHRCNWLVIEVSAT